MLLRPYPACPLWFSHCAARPARAARALRGLAGCARAGARGAGAGAGAAPRIARKLGSGMWQPASVEELWLYATNYQYISYISYITCTPLD